MCTIELYDVYLCSYTLLRFLWCRSLKATGTYQWKGDNKSVLLRTEKVSKFVKKILNEKIASIGCFLFTEFLDSFQQRSYEQALAQSLLKWPGTNVIIFEIFSAKIIGKTILEILLVYANIGFEKNVDFFRRKLAKFAKMVTRTLSYWKDLPGYQNSVRCQLISNNLYHLYCSATSFYQHALIKFIKSSHDLLYKFLPLP
jgi:hypothetical protein